MPHRFLSILLLALALGGCKEKSEKPASNAPIKQYKLEGVVVSLDPQGHIVKIDGQEIKGWMGAMTMEYPVKYQKEFDTLHVGDHIEATVYVQDLDYWLGEIHRAP